MRKLVFEDSSNPIPIHSSSNSSVFLSTKIIQKPKLMKFSSPSKLQCKKSPQFLFSKCSTPNPEIKTLNSLDLKVRSYSSMEMMPKLFIEEIYEDSVLEETKKSKPFNLISKETLAEMLQKNQDNDLLIVDCRYAFEFQGGHIKNAVNINNDPFRLMELFFFGSEGNNIETETTISQNDLKTMDYSEEKLTDNLTLSKTSSLLVSPTKEIVEKLSEMEFSFSKKKKIIFHCEFSQSRGPKMYNLLRSFDREINFKNYPKLTFPDIHLLEGGYSLFSEAFPELCEPKGEYRKMMNKSFGAEFVKGQINSRKMWDLLGKNKEKILQTLVKGDN